MMPKYLIDTDICIFFIQGKFNLLQKFNEVEFENCYVSAITINELQYGARKSSNLEKHKHEAA